MHTHRYVRTRLVEDNPRDRYDLKIVGLQHHHQYAEYWTNGRTTLLHIPTNNTSGGSVNNTTTATIANKSVIMTSQQQEQQQSTTPATPSSSSSSTSSSPSRSTGNTFQKKTTTNSSSSNNNNNTNVIRNSLLAGSAAGMASTIACHPFDVIRVKMQSSAPLAAAAAATATTSTTAAAAAAAAAASTTTTGGSIGMVATVRNTIQFGGGLRALYTGLTLPLAAQAVYKSTVFTVNNVTETFIKEWQTQENYKLGNFTPYKLTLWDKFLSGFMGGAVNAALFCTPVEYVRNQQIAQIGSSSSKSLHTMKASGGPISVIQRTVNTNGIQGLWRGMASTILRDSVGCGFFFVSMAYAQEYLSSPSTTTSRFHDDHTNGSKVQQQQPPPSTSTIIISGAVAGVSFWIWALPVDTLKTWIQNGSATNLTHAIQMSQRHGLLQSIPSLFRGWQVAYTRGAPSAAITVLTYSLVLQHLQQQEGQEVLQQQK